ncbi:glutamine amidotransferase, partial [Methylocucumis oryzae]
MKPLLIVKTGSTYPAIQQQFGDFDDWLQSTCACEHVLYQVWLPELEPPPEPTAFSGVIITGSPAMVTEQKDWMRSAAQWLLTVMERDIPVLGICFGHQLLAYALGGVVDYHPLGREIGTVSIALTDLSADDDLFATLPICFNAHVTHAQSVRVLPCGAKVLGGNAFEP